MRIAGGHEVEVVYIPEDGRGTLCISSQVGCTLTCSFCHTGTQKLVRNLTAGEIVGQVMMARDDLGEWPEQGARKDERRLLSNIVLMGMGEPLYNFENVRDAMKIAMDPEGIQLSAAAASPCRPLALCPRSPAPPTRSAAMLAVSFHATTDEVRDKLVPINKKWNIEALLDALRAYPKVSNSERITFEYVMLNGVNDSDEDARRLVELIEGIPAKINLIPFNEWPGAPYKRVEQPHPRLCRYRLQGGLCQPDPHAARRGYHGRLRAAEIRDRAGAQIPPADRIRGRAWLRRTP